MSDLPQRIWATGDRVNGSWTSQEIPPKWGANAVEYVRADTVQAQIDAAREAALQDAISHVRQALIDDAHKYGSIATTRSSAMFTAEIIATNALSRILPPPIRKGDQP